MEMYLGTFLFYRECRTEKQAKDNENNVITEWFVKHANQIK